MIKRVAFILTSVLVVGVLSQVLRNDLVWDDKPMLARPGDTGVFQRFPENLTVPFWYNAAIVDAEISPLWRPLTTFTLWLGELASTSYPAAFPWIYHLISLLGAIAATLSLFHLMWSLFPTEKGRDATIWIALLYLAHPLTAEVICMACNVSDHLALSFLFLALTRTFRYFRATNGASELWPVPLLVFLSCSAKEFGVICAMLPLASWLLERGINSDLKIAQLKSPILWLATAIPVFMFIGLRTVVLQGATTTVAPDLRPEQAFLAVGQSLKQIVFMLPEGTNIVFERHSPLQWSLSIFCIIAAILYILRTRRSQGRQITIPLVAPLLGFALFLPSLLGAGSDGDIVFLPTRYFHLVLAGVLIGSVPLAIHLVTRRLVFILPLAIILASTLSFSRIGQWRDEPTLYTAEHLAHPHLSIHWANALKALVSAERYDDAIVLIHNFQLRNAPLSQNDESTRLMELSRIAMKRDRNFNLATSLAVSACEINPKSFVALLNLVIIRNEAGHPEESLRLFKEAEQSGSFTPSQQKILRERIRFYEKRLTPDSGRLAL